MTVNKTIGYVSRDFNYKINKICFLKDKTYLFLFHIKATDVKISPGHHRAVFQQGRQDRRRGDYGGRYEEVLQRHETPQVHVGRVDGTQGVPGVPQHVPAGRERRQGENI